MPSLKAIRRRITSVKSTGKITRAMKLVATAKLRRAQERLVQNRPYALRVQEMIRELARGAATDDHVLLSVRPPRRTLLLLLTSDRGLAGAFNANVNKAAWNWVQRNREGRDHIELRIVGKKGRDFFKSRPVTVGHVYTDVLNNLTLERAADIGRELVAAYVDGGFDEVFLVFNEFKSAITQKVCMERILPIRPEHTEVEGALYEMPARPTADTLYEPSKDAVLDNLLPMSINVQVYRGLLESVASEMGARMTAMDAATKNASELLARITLQYNRARQAIITTELMEITSGAEALKG
ncbi:MAG: ATP synthase F1 subunit gamma [Deltaproteobacteria bacterium]|nr:ATP synthase F1 subunit gamma [Deltaproteobacteria bacterium]